MSLCRESIVVSCSMSRECGCMVHGVSWDRRERRREAHLGPPAESTTRGGRGHGRFSKMELEREGRGQTRDTATESLRETRPSADGAVRVSYD